MKRLATTERPKLTLDIPSMSCGHCARAVTQAVQFVDPQARGDVDLATQQVRTVTGVPREAVVAPLVEAGYTPA